MPKVTKERKIATITKGPVYVYDLTYPSLSIDGKDEHAKNEKKQIDLFMKSHCKKWAYQLEKGNTNYVHWQIRISLGVKKRGSELKQILAETELKGAHISPTSGTGHHGFNYVTKESGRLWGPFSDKDDPNEDAEDTEDMKLCNEDPYVWQRKWMELIKAYKMDTHIHLLIDVFGKGGKSTWAKLLAKHKKAVWVPLLDTVEKMIGFAMGKYKEGVNCFILDISRTIEPKQLKHICSAIEIMKSGNLMDWRYQAQQLWITPPMVIILSNWDLPAMAFSKGRLIRHLIHKGNSYTFTAERYTELKEKYDKEMRESAITEESKEERKDELADTPFEA